MNERRSFFIVCDSMVLFVFRKSATVDHLGSTAVTTLILFVGTKFIADHKGQ